MVRFRVFRGGNDDGDPIKRIFFLVISLCAFCYACYRLYKRCSCCCKKLDTPDNGAILRHSTQSQRTPMNSETSRTTSVPVHIPPAEYFMENETIRTPNCQEPQEKYPQLNDFSSADDIKQLNVKQLKCLLAINRVDFRGCLEKEELQDKAIRLWQDNQQHNDISETAPPSELCKVCMDGPLECVLLECGHIASCIECGKNLTECPICRQYVVRVIRTFKA